MNGFGRLAQDKGPSLALPRPKRRRRARKGRPLRPDKLSRPGPFSRDAIGLSFPSLRRPRNACSHRPLVPCPPSPWPTVGLGVDLVAIKLVVPPRAKLLDTLRPAIQAARLPVASLGSPSVELAA